MPFEAFRVGGGGPARRQRIASIEWRVLDRTALNAAVVLVRAFRVHLASDIAVVAGIGVDEAPDGAALGRESRLDGAKGVAVSDDHNLARDVDAVALKLLVVFPQTIVDIYELVRDIAVRRKGVVRRQHVRRRAALIPDHAAFNQGSREGVRFDHFKAPRFWNRKQHLVACDFGVVSPFGEQALQGLDIALPVAGADVMGLSSQFVHPGAQVGCFEMAVENCFKAVLNLRAVVRKSW